MRFSVCAHHWCAYIARMPLEHADPNRLAFALSPDGPKLTVLNGCMPELWIYE